MRPSIVTAACSTDNAAPVPVPPEWVVEGNPQTRSKLIARSRDRNTKVWVWECTPGRFKWNYDKDETLVVISGEAFITDEKGAVRRIGAGDIVFFPAGSSSAWQVTSHIKKVAVLRHSMPPPLGLAVMAWTRVLQMLGLLAKSPAIGGVILLLQDLVAN